MAAELGTIGAPEATSATSSAPPAPRPAGQVADLELRRVVVTYNRVAVAIQEVSLRVPAGRVVAVLGANGAGKTTTLRAVSGFLPGDGAAVTGGTVLYGHADLTGRKPHVVARRGVVLIPERHKVFATLSVEDNLRCVPVPKDRGDHAATLALIDELFPVLSKRRRQLAGYLSGGERQMLAIAKALLLEPNVLLADELSLGIAPALLTRILEAVRQINAQRGASVLLVEQNAAAALEIADHVYVLETGRVVLDGTPAELTEHADVQNFYLGTSDGSGERSYADVKQYRKARRWAR
ncbi:MAG: ATP-binding cassette domain-containing protein [Acidimicrobiia bacterium]|nr:ATP-binding cassette domain-containing protein [Acidimicrobiia bacterium]